MILPVNVAPNDPQARSLAGLRVLSLESRRAPEIARLIANYGGEPTVAPSMREAPLESNVEALAFIRALLGGHVDMVIFLTGVGARALARLADTIAPREEFVAALRRAQIVARGPKPVAALQEMSVAPALQVPEPNTWRDLLHALDEKSASLPLAGRRVAVQEYGAENSELLAGLAQRGAQVTRVPVYQWSLPEDTAPLRLVVEAVAGGRLDVVLFTTSVQITHLLQIAAEMNLEPALRAGLSQMVIGSIGPITSQALREHGLSVDFEPPHPKMGFLVAEAAQRAAQLLRSKREGQS